MKPNPTSEKIGSNYDSTCWSCGGQGSWHECLDDCCPCLKPEDNVECEICKGKGLLL